MSIFGQMAEIAAALASEFPVPLLDMEALKHKENTFARGQN